MIGGLSGCAPSSGGSQKPADEVSFNPDTYRAEAMGHNAPILVDTTFSDARIEDIVVVKQTESHCVGDWAMDAIREEILERQSLAVDTVAGATISSMMFLSTVTDAVEQAGANPADIMIEEPLDSDPLPNETVDVVIVGGGGPGLVAAVKAHERGLNVLLVEQLGILGGCASRSGGLMAGGTKLQREYGQTEPTTDDMYEAMSAPLSSTSDPGLYDDEYVKGFSVRAAEIIDWLYDMGVEFGEPLPLTLGAAHSMLHMADGMSRIMWNAVEKLRGYLDDNGVPYRLNTRAIELIQEGDTVTGVLVEAPNGTTYEISAKAVILGTGGYLANREMIAKYAPSLVDNLYDVTVGADGSGIDLAEKAGGVPTLMNKVATHAFAASFNGASRSMQMMLSTGAIAVNSDGRRYCNESGYYVDSSAATMREAEQGRQTFCIIDAAMTESEPFKNDRGLSNIIEMYTKGDTIEELAKALGINAENLKDEIKKYGGYVRNGEDPDFGRFDEGLTHDFAEGPYYGVKGKAENHTVYGGIKTNNSARVLQANGSEVKGLYAIGELALFKEAGRAPLTHGMDLAIQAVADIA
jgi:fumarate reductase flavoprotein subunit